jgi:glycosyltransferase
VEIVKSYRSRIAFWTSEEDEGIADAFNKGFAASSGVYVLYLNSDDRLAGPEVIGNMVEMIHRHQSPTLIYGDIDYIDRESGRFLRRASISFTRKHFLRGHMFPHPGLFAHRKYFVKYGYFDTTFKFAMDYEWLLRGALKEHIVHVPVLIAKFRTGGTSDSDESRVKNEIIAALRKNGFISSRLGEMKMRCYFLIRATAKYFLRRLGLHAAYLWTKRRLKDFY